MKSNFDFLKQNENSAKYVNIAVEAENLYAAGEYASELISIRKIAENISSFILVQNRKQPANTFNQNLTILRKNNIIQRHILDIFYSMKQQGNKSAHTLESFSHSLGLSALKQLVKLLYWFAEKYAGYSGPRQDFVEPQLRITYNTFDRKLIYSLTADNTSGKWPAYVGREKVGEATIDTLEADMTKNSRDLREAAQKRIRSYMGTSGVPVKLEWAEAAYRILNGTGTWFSDHDVHKVLERSNVKRDPALKENGGHEWFITDIDTVKQAITAVKEGREFINAPSHLSMKVHLRPEQKEAVLKTEKVFKSKNRMLWNAKMRFGKTLSALQLIKEEGYNKVLIMTHRPVVKDSWFQDFSKINMMEAGYTYGSKKGSDPSLDALERDAKKFIYFASIQDLRGSRTFGGAVGDKNELVGSIDWDLVIIDEAHEGTQTDLAQNVIDGVTKANTRILELSGTPFNLIDKYKPEQVYTWDYVMEQEAKYNWSESHPGKENPYQKMPRVSMYTFEMKRKFSDQRFLDVDQKSFNFHEFFRVNSSGKFVYEQKVVQFLNNITTPSRESHFPYSTREFRDKLRHTLWLMPSVAAARAMKELLSSHPVFGMEYTIVNVVDNGDDIEASKSDLEKVRQAISKYPARTKTITLTVRKLTTGVNIPEWTGIVFLSNTSSAMQYLQAAFRAQTPFSDAEMGEKTDCYIFDFAPDRALKIMADSSRLNTGAGKIQTKEQKNKMATLLNFLPIIGEKGQGMKPYQVDSLLTRLKRVYAEKAVHTGFDDDSLYNDELLRLTEADVSDFNNLRAIIGNTKSTKNLKKIDINHQGLTDEEYDKASEVKKKPKEKQTQEDRELLQREKRLKKQRETMISILRSISIRIPMMIYGMAIDLDQDVDIPTFIENVDSKSWEEFMPKGVTKLEFKKFSKYYDSQIFIEAGKIIRQRVKRMDKLEPIERAGEIGLLFGTFKNPDKETVLTPWRVVNLQIGETLGGYSFFDNEYNNLSKNGINVNHWIDLPLTERIFSRDSKFLEINSKTGLYPLYLATSLYYKEQAKLNAKTAGRFTINDEKIIWETILKNNIFVIAKTPMAKTITERTLSGYTDQATNVKFIDDLVATARQNIKNGIVKIKEAFPKLKFDVVVGNPPYQEDVARKVSENGQSPVTNIFQLFQQMADEVTGRYTNLIYPGKRWLHRSGKGLAKFGLQQINDPHLARIIYFPDSQDVFPGIAIADGITIVVKDMKKEERGFKYSFVKDGKTKTIHLDNPGEKLIQVDPADISPSKKIDEFVKKEKLDFVGNDPIKNRSLFKIESDFVEKNPEKARKYKKGMNLKKDEIKLYTNDRAGKMGRARWFVVKKDVIKSHAELINEWQVVVSSANAGGQKRDNQMRIIDNHSAFGRSRLALKSFKTETEAKNFLKYCQSTVVRYAFLLTDEALTSVGKEVPDIIDYTDNNNYINFNKDIDAQLVELLRLTSSEYEHIKNKVSSVR